MQLVGLRRGQQRSTTKNARTALWRHCPDLFSCLDMDPAHVDNLSVPVATHSPPPSVCEAEREGHSDCSSAFVDLTPSQSDAEGSGLLERGLTGMVQDSLLPVATADRDHGTLGRHRIIILCYTLLVLDVGELMMRQQLPLEHILTFSAKHVILWLMIPLMAGRLFGMPAKTNERELGDR